MTEYYRSIFLVFLVFIPNIMHAKKFSFIISAEGGPYCSTSLSNEIMARFSGRIQYLNSVNRTQYLVKVRIIPEFYAPENPLQAIKVRGSFQLKRIENNFSWQAHLSNRYNYYSLKQLNRYSDNLFLIGGKLNFALNKDFLFLFAMDYLKRDIFNPAVNNLSSITGHAGLEYSFKNKTHLAIQLYLENYMIESEQETVAGKQNNGWRFGPQVELRHRSSYIFNITYHFLFVTSQLSTQSTSLHRLQLIWGKYFGINWSAFLFINLLLQNSVSDQIPDELVYLPLNNENWLYLKTGYDLNVDTELFLKCGYARDELFNQNLSLSGWQILLGINHKF